MRPMLWLSVALIFATGLVMIFSTTSAEVLDMDLDKSTHHAPVKQLCYAIAGVLASGAIWKIGYRRLLRYSPPLLGIFSILLLLALLPGIGKEVNGSKRWISIAGLSLQPSEFIKYIIPAFFITRYLPFRNGEFTFKDFLKLIAVVSIPMVLILAEPNNGTVAVIGITLIMLFFLLRLPFKYWAMPLLALMMVAAFSVYTFPYVNARLRVYMNPESDLLGKGHQPYQAKIAVGSGQLIGKGPGNSWQKLSYLPEAQNDYIAAIFAEEFGFIGILLLILCYSLIGYLGFSIANQSSDLQGFYLASSITFLICFQAFLNLGVVSGLLPSTGLNLPFFSQGGSSLIANLMGVGLLLSIDDKSKRCEAVVV